MDDIRQAKSKDIANYVVIYKILGIHRELSIKCMEELHRREQAGDDFDYTAYINKEGEKSPGELVELIVQDVNHFAGKAPQHDDITLLVMKIQ